MKIFSLYKEYIKNCKIADTKPISKKDFERIEYDMKKMAHTKDPYLTYSSQIDSNWVYFVIKKNGFIDAKIISLALLGAIKQYEMEANR